MDPRIDDHFTDPSGTQSLRGTRTSQPLSETTNGRSLSNAEGQEWSLFAELMSSNNSHGQRAQVLSQDDAGTSAHQPLIQPLSTSFGSLSTSSARQKHRINGTQRSLLLVNTETPRQQLDNDPTNSHNATPEVFSRGRESRSRWNFTLTKSHKDILKCALAYFIASLFTYASPLANILAKLSEEGVNSFPLGHLVATVAVYFNPAKSIGAMVEADAYCVAGFLYSAVVSLTSMSLYWFFEPKPGWEWLADTAVITIVAASTGIVAWTKVWMNKPSFSTACSMMVIIIFIVVVREGGLLTLLHVASTVLLGAIVSNCVCFLLWSRSATALLRGDIVKTLDSFAVLLDVLTGNFLLDVDQKADVQKLQIAIKDHQSSFTTLKKSLLESKSEWRLAGRTTIAYDDAVTSLNRLAQHLGGLRSVTQRQEEFMTDLLSWQNTIDFREDIKGLASPMCKLSKNCVKVLQGMHAIFAASDTTISEFEGLSEEISTCLKEFAVVSNQQVLDLFCRDMVLAESKTANLDVETREERLFLVYFFVFTLEQFAEELVILIGALGRIYIFETFYSKQSWLQRYMPGDARHRSQQSPARPRLKRSISSALRFESKRDSRYFPDTRPHAPNTAQMPPRSSLSIWGRFKQSLWVLYERLRESDKLYALKVGIATGMLAAPAFFDSTRPAFTRYRGEWALISFFVVLSPTIGATNFLSIHRLGGTLLGAGTACLVYWSFPHNPFVLSIFGALFSCPCFWLILDRPTYATTGRFILLTYNLTCLYSYNTRGDPISIGDIALRRIVAVSVGVLWALFVSRFWWPSWARRELSKNLSELCANLGWFYTKLIAAYSAPASGRRHYTDAGEQSTLGRTAILTESELRTAVEEFQAMELHLQLQLIRLQGLLAQTQHEPRLKGPFPITLYRSVLASLQSILDQLHSARCVTIRADAFVNVRQDFIIPVNNERREMVGNVVLYFSILSSAFRLKTPLAPYLPPAEESRKRVVSAIRNLPVVKMKQVETSQQLLYFAYVLTMKSVIQELDFVGRTLQDAFGVIGQRREDFERLFMASQQLV